MTPSIRPAALALLCAALVVPSAACAPKSDEGTGGQAAAEAEPAVPLADQPITEDEAKAVFEAWLAAQTTLDFDAYSRVYAEDFEGIKRNGHTTKHLTRAEWLESRAKNFDKGFKITATGLDLGPSETKAKGAGPKAMVARFTQRWSTPSYADIGPKELIIARRGETPMIVHEEMLSSHITRRKGRTNPPLMVLKVGDTHYAVLGAGDAAWTDETKPPTLLDPDTVTRPLFVDEVDKSMRKWIGREVEVVGQTPCTAKIAQLEVAGRVIASSELDDNLWAIEEQGREPTEAEYAAAMWPMIADEVFLFGKLDACEGNLATPVDAKDQTELVNFALTTELDEALAKGVNAAFRALPDYRAEQKSYLADFNERKEFGDEDSQGEPGQWDEPGDDWGEKSIQMWTAGEERFVFRSASVGGDCGFWSGSLWALWRVGEGDTLELVGTGPESGGFMGESTLEPTALVRWHDAMWIRTAHELYEVKARGQSLLIHATEPVFFGCNC